MEEGRAWGIVGAVVAVLFFGLLILIIAPLSAFTTARINRKKNLSHISILIINIAFSSVIYFLVFGYQCFFPLRLNECFPRGIHHDLLPFAIATGSLGSVAYLLRSKKILAVSVILIPILLLAGVYLFMILNK